MVLEATASAWGFESLYPHQMKNTYLSKKAFELEGKMIPTRDWLTAHPEAYRIATEATKEGIPTGIAFDDSLGWCVIMAGQGPYIAWAEHDETTA